MKNYKQLSLEQRCQIQSLYNVGFNQIQIAVQLSVHRSTICRELKRNVPKREQTAGMYIADHAQRKTESRHKEKPKVIYLTERLKTRIAGLMGYEKWSPELISATLRKNLEPCVSHETIYRWIWTAKHSNHRKHRKYKMLFKDLCYSGRRQRRGNIKDNRGAITGGVGMKNGQI